MRKLAFVSLLLLWLGACGDDSFWRRHGLPHGGSGNGGGSGGDEDALEALAGAWKELDSAPGYQAYLVIEADGGQGYLCNEDGKSQAEFALNVDGDQVFMGEYGYGEGDELALQTGGEIVRTGIDHGETYTVRYARATQLPAWCRLQIGEMRRD